MRTKTIHMTMQLFFTTALAAWLSCNLAAGAADELRVTLKGGGISGTFPVTPTETSCGRINWDGVPDKSGDMSGGQCEITVQLVDKSVVLKEHTLVSDKGIRSDIIAKTIVPTAKVPWTGKISQTTVTVFRVEPDKENSPASPVPPQVGPSIPVIKRGDKIVKHLGDGTPLKKNYGESKQLLDSHSSVPANTEVMMWKVGDGTLVIETSLGAGFIVDINYVITDSKDEKRTTLKVKEFNPSTGDMTLAIPNTHN